MKAILPLLFVLLLVPRPLYAQTSPRPLTVPAATAAPATAASDASLPGSRTLKNFDFEESALGNFESTPMFWSKVVGNGFPAYSAGAFDHAVFRSANSSFKLQTAGGSVAYRFAPPAANRIPILPDADYYILAFVRTTQLKYARADLAAWFTDDQGHLLLDSESHAQAYRPANARGEDPPGAWQVLYIYLPGPPPSSTAKPLSLSLQVGILQPQQLGAIGQKNDPNDLGRFSLYQQDIQGSAWFDDIVVFQLPRVSVNLHKAENATSPALMFAPGEPVELDLLVSDLTEPTAKTAANLGVRLRVTDATGLVFANEQWHANASPEKAWTQRFSHAPLPAGLYTATMDVLDSSDAAHTPALIARREAQFLSLPATPFAPQPPAKEFAIGATTWSANPDSWKDLPLLLRHMGAGTVQIPAWRRDMTDEALTRRDPPFDALVAALRRTNVRTIGALSEIPDPIALHLGKAAEARESILTLLSADPLIWRPSMSQLLTRLADRIDLWELGSPAYPFSGALPGAGEHAKSGDGLSQADPRAAALFNTTFKEMSGLMSQPQLVIPWNALVDFDATQYPHASLDLRLPAVIKPAQIPAYLASFREPGAIPLTQPRSGPAAGPASSAARVPIFAHIEGLNARDNSRSDRLADFAQRLVFTRSAAPDLIIYDAPPEPVANSSAVQAAMQSGPGTPDELLLVYRTMIHALAGTDFVGEISLATAPEGVRGFLFKKLNATAESNGTLVLWNESTSTHDAPMLLPLGAQARGIDLLGNTRPLPRDASTQLTQIIPTAAPQIIEQIDPRPLQLRASFALATSNIPAGAGSLRTQVLLTNPYSESLNGTLRLLPPKGWTTDPPSLTVALAPGARMRQSVTLRYPFTENAGPKTIAARLTLESPPPGNPTGLAELDFTFPCTLTSEQVEMEGFSLVQPNGDISLQQVITNISSTPLNGQAYALVPGFQRQQHYIVGLQPGQTTVKRFLFPAAGFISPDGKTNLSAADVARFMANQSATVGIRQTDDGKTLLTKAIPFE